MKDVRHVPEITKNLISTGQLDDFGFIVTFGKGPRKISRGCITILKGQKDGSLYIIQGTTQKNGGTKDMAATTSKRDDIQVWHSWLGHLSECGMQVLQNKTSFLLLSILFLSFVIIPLWPR